MLSAICGPFRLRLRLRLRFHKRSRNYGRYSVVRTPTIVERFNKAVYHRVGADGAKLTNTRLGSTRFASEVQGALVPWVGYPR